MHSSQDSSTQHCQRAAFLRERAAEFKARDDDAALSYAADLECEADEIDALLRAGPIDGDCNGTAS
jgi:hypothetical protein